MRREQHVIADRDNHVFKCFNCGAEEPFDHPMPLMDYLAARTQFFDEHKDCPVAEGEPRDDSENEEEELHQGRAPEPGPIENGHARDVKIVREEGGRKPVKGRPKCSRCGQSGHNATTCEKQAGGPPAEKRAAPARRVVARKRRSPAPAPEAPPVASATGPPAGVHGFTVHMKKSIVTVSEEAGATVIRIGEV